MSNAVHIKRHTRGTSNEISFSVLDAAKNAQDEPSSSRRAPQHPILGAISMFTLGRWKKPIRTPRREHGLTLSTGSSCLRRIRAVELRVTCHLTRTERSRSHLLRSRVPEPMNRGLAEVKRRGSRPRVQPTVLQRSGSWTLPQEKSRQGNRPEKGETRVRGVLRGGGCRRVRRRGVGDCEKLPGSSREIGRAARGYDRRRR